MKKKIPLLILLLLLALHTKAQDTLYFKNGSKQIVKVEELGSNKIKYKEPNYIDGPSYYVPVEQLRACILASGDTLKFKSVFAPGVSNKNQIDLNLFALHKGEIFVAYQRFFGKDKTFSFRIPLSFMFDTPSSQYWNFNKVIATGIGFYNWKHLFPALHLAVGYNLGYSVYRDSEFNISPYYTGYSYQPLPKDYELQDYHYISHTLSVGLRCYMYKRMGFNTSLGAGIRDNMFSNQSNPIATFELGFFAGF